MHSKLEISNRISVRTPDRCFIQTLVMSISCIKSKLDNSSVPESLHELKAF